MVSPPLFARATQTILGKVSELRAEGDERGEAAVDPHERRELVTVTSTATIAANTWYHFAGVYNGDYTGTPQFGYTTQGSVQLAMPGITTKGRRRERRSTTSTRTSGQPQRKGF
jgi:hypothetical protein